MNDKKFIIFAVILPLVISGMILIPIAMTSYENRMDTVNKTIAFHKARIDAMPCNGLHTYYNTIYDDRGLASEGILKYAKSMLDQCMINHT